MDSSPYYVILSTAKNLIKSAQNDVNFYAQTIPAFAICLACNYCSLRYRGVWFNYNILSFTVMLSLFQNPVEILR